MTPWTDDELRLYELALAQAERGTNQQQSVLDHLRTRAVGLIAIGSGVATFVGVQADVGSGNLGNAGKAGLALYLVSVLLAAFVLLPRRDWKFQHDAKRIIQQFDEPPRPGEYAETVRNLALRTEEHRKKNKDKLATLTYAYAAGVVLLGVQVVLWVVEAR